MYGVNLLIILFLQYTNGCMYDRSCKQVAFFNNQNIERNLCASGKRQSPIAIEGCELKQLPELRFIGHWDIRHEGFKMIHHGENIEVTFFGRQPILRGGTLRSNYIFEQLHFHWGLNSENGSEHSLFGKSYALEMHLVHYKQEYGTFENAANKPDGLAVVAVLFDGSRYSNPVLNTLINGISRITNPEESTILPPDSFTWLKQYFTNYKENFIYSGSLTTPPCAETVTWIILARISYIGENQLKIFRTIIHENGNLVLSSKRDQQPLNNRIILCSRQGINY